MSQDSIENYHDIVNKHHNNNNNNNNNNSSNNNNNKTIINYLAYRLNSTTMDTYEPSLNTSHHHHNNNNNNNNNTNNNNYQQQQQQQHCHPTSVTSLSTAFGADSADSTPTSSKTQFLYEYPLKAPKTPIRRRNYCKLFFKILIVLVSFAGFLYQATDICAHYFSYR